MESKSQNLSDSGSIFRTGEISSGTLTETTLVLLKETNCPKHCVALVINSRLHS